jgi:osmotically-inducible protein OsmY
MKRLVVTLAFVGLFACQSTDVDVNRRVLMRLDREPTPTEQFTVTTHGRVVKLKGVVHSAAEREHLEKAVREVDGVAGVENQLVIDAPVELTGSDQFLAADPVDSLIRDEIRSRLDAQALDDIAVEVKDRVVTLTGRVPGNVHDAALKVVNDVTRTDKRARVEDHLVLSD